MAVTTEVASLVSKAKFEIDTVQLEKFENLTKGIRLSVVNMARQLKGANVALNTTASKLRVVNNSLDSTNSKKGAKSLANGYASLSKNVNVAQTNLNRFSNTLTSLDPKLGNQEDRIRKLTTAWADYSKRVKEANASVAHMRSQTPKPVSRTSVLGSVKSSTAGQSGSSGGGSGGSSFMAGIAGSAAGRFAGAFAPSAALAGGAVSAGFAAKKVIDTGRDYMAMRQILMASSRDLADFNQNLEFTKRATNELGTNVIEFGKAYAKTIQSVGDKLPRKETEEMFLSFSKLMVVMHSSDDDQKGVFRAMSQMFSKGKIQMEEINQMAERNVPALAMMTRAYKELGMTQAEFEKAQQKGQLDPSKFLPLMAKYAKEFAMNNGALEKALKGSVTQQGIFMNRMRELSDKIMEGGLDRLLGDMFKGATQLAEVMTPLAIGLSKAVLGFGELLKMFGAFAKEHPIVAGGIGLLIGRLIFLRKSFKLAGGAGVGFFALLGLGIKNLKMLMLRSGILAIFLGIGEILGALYEHMNGDNNWLSLMIVKFELFAAKLGLVYEQFKTVMTAIWEGLKNNVITNFFSRLFSIFGGDGFEKGMKESLSKSPLVTEEQRKAMPVGNPYTGYKTQTGAVPTMTPQQQQMAKNLQMANGIPNLGSGVVNRNINMKYHIDIAQGGNMIYQKTQTQKINTGGL